MLCRSVCLGLQDPAGVLEGRRTPSSGLTNPSKIELACLSGPGLPFLVGKLRSGEDELSVWLWLLSQHSRVGCQHSPVAMFLFGQSLDLGSRRLFWTGIPGRKKPVPCTSIDHLLCVSGGPRFHSRPSLGPRKPLSFSPQVGGQKVH